VVCACLRASSCVLSRSPPARLPASSLHDALPIFLVADREAAAQLGRHVLGAHPFTGLVRIHHAQLLAAQRAAQDRRLALAQGGRSEEHTSELQSRENVVCRLLLEKKKGRGGSRVT